MLFLKDASGLSKSTKELDSILLSFHCYLGDHLKYSPSCKRFLELQLYCSLAVQCTSNFGKNLKFTEVCVLFQKFFWHESQLAGPITKIKKVNVE